MIVNNILSLHDIYGIDFEIYTHTPGNNRFLGFHVNRFHGVGFEWYRISPEMIRLLKHVDIVHIHHYGYWPPYAGLINGLVSKKPVVFTPHYHPIMGHFGKRAFRYIYHSSQGFTLLKLSDAILPITEHEKGLLVRIGASPQKTFVVPNPVDTNLFRPVKKKSNIILFVGVLEEHKGAHIAFEMFKELLTDRLISENTQMVFVGKGSLRKQLVNEAKKQHMQKHFKFMQNLSSRKLIELYSSSKLLVLPSRYEAFGMVLAEAMACGTPVVATRVGGIPEVVGNCGRLVEYGEWERMKKHIIDVINMPEDKYRRLSERCRKRVVSKFDSRVVAKKLFEVYSHVYKDIK